MNVSVFFLIPLYYAIALLLRRGMRVLAPRILDLNRLAPAKRRWRADRIQTLHGLIVSLTSFIAFLIATIFSLGLFVDTDTLVWMIGLFSAAFGLSARPVISDYLTGLGFIFEDSLDLNDKIELQIGGTLIEGIVEAMYLRVTLVRATGGELYMVPNGEIRVIRNFSRGRYTTVKVRVHLATKDLEHVIDLLESLGEDAPTYLPNLLEPWSVISPTGEVGAQTELTILAKARFGQGAKMRPRLLSLVQKKLNEAEIQLVG